MDIDFALVLVLSVAATGGIWLLDLWLLAPRRQAVISAANAGSSTPLDPQTCKQVAPEPVVVEYAKSFFPVLALVLVLRSFLVEPFQIPSGSMLPTLEIGDFILVNKYHYGIRLPVINTKVIAINDPQRGDVVVFKYPNNPRVNYIKRLVGLPGDHIRYDNKTLIINGEVMSQSLVAQLPPLAPQRELLVERLGEVQHEIYKDLTRPRPVNEWVE
ncbi:MAG TPA: signal peptidase I, partial [Motiliproteus sp.]